MTTNTRPPIPRLIRVGTKRYSVEIVEAMLEKRTMGQVHYPTRKIQIGLKSNVTGKKFKDEIGRAHV